MRLERFAELAELAKFAKTTHCAPIAAYGFSLIVARANGIT